MPVPESQAGRMVSGYGPNPQLNIPRDRIIAAIPVAEDERTATGDESTNEHPLNRDGDIYEVLYLTPHPEEEPPKDGKLQVASALHPEQRVEKRRIRRQEVPGWVLDDFSVLDGREAKDGSWIGPESLRADEEREVVVIVSPASGSGAGEGIWEGVVRSVLESFGLKELRVWDQQRGGWVQGKATGTNGYMLYVTRSKEDIHTIARDLLPTSRAKEQLIILLSGDTVISELLNSLPPASSSPTQRIFSLIPTGTGNALASSLHKQYNSLATLTLGRPHQHPTFLAYFSSGQQIRGAVVLSWGFHASLVADSDAKEYRQKYGNERFAVAARENLLPEPHIYRGTVKVQGVIPETTTPQNGAVNNPEHFYTLVALVSNLEKNLIISPHTPAPTPFKVSPSSSKSSISSYTARSPAQSLVPSTNTNGLSQPTGESTPSLSTSTSNSDSPSTSSKAAPATPAPPITTTQSSPSNSTTPSTNPGNHPSAMHLIQIAPRLHPTRIMGLMRAAYANGSHVHEPEVMDTPCVGVDICFEEEDYVSEDGECGWGRGRWRRVCVDGAIFEVEKGGWVKVALEEGEGAGMGVLWKG